jgi:hypothetical protein
LALVLFGFSALSVCAATHYVWQSSPGPAPPYTTWATAAATIQQAVDAAAARDEIVVTNGAYAPVTVYTPLVLRSVNGPEATVIDGGSAVRCVYLTNGATLVGFTLTNGYANLGGGVYCESASAVLSNCVLSGNWASGAISGNGGGAYGGTLNNCTLTGNSAYGHILWFLHIPGYGGGAKSCTLNNCTLSGNSAGAGGGAESCTLNNCTVTGNSGWGASSATLNNCIVYFNSDPNGGNYDPSSTLNYCCTTPMPTNGVGNISADPQLASASHLSAESPCRAAGSARYASGTDIDGDAWANPPSIGCDEYHAGTVTGPLTVAIWADYTNVAKDFPAGLTAFIEGRTDLSVWDFGDGFVQVNEPYTSHTWTAPGDYLVALWAFNDSYPGGVSAAVKVHVEAEVLHYVAATSSNPVAPYTSWATAATNIQNAVDAAAVGDEIVVTNGTYAPVTVNTPLTLQSVNGPDVTVIDGGGEQDCLYLTSHAMLVGFTLTNGFTYGYGGGVYCESSSAVLTNCVLTGNLALNGGYGGGAYGGTLKNCTLTSNVAVLGGGGGAYDSTLNNCTLIGNSAPGGEGGGATACTLNNCTLTANTAGSGGGADGCTLNNCTLTGNNADSCYSAGGGAYNCTLNNCTLTGNFAYGGGSDKCVLGYAIGGGAADSTLNNCTLTGNLVPNGSGGGAADSTLNNCTLTGNSASYGGGSSSFFAPCMLNNCTLTGNSATNSGGGAWESTLNNCIVYFNTSTNGANYCQDQYDGVLNYCCTTPMPTNGVGNITNAPVFVDYAGGNLRLQTNSPCINSGNNTYAPGPTDLDGNPRIVGGTVDIGAYEYQTPTSIISYAWLQQYGLPTDGSADHADLDGTGMNVYQDWIAGLNPTNVLSVLKLLAPVKTNNPAGLVVTWQSVNTRTYYLQSSTNLAAQPAFSTIQSNIVGQAGTTSYTDTTAANAGPYFYRVGVGQ